MSVHKAPPSLRPYKFLVLAVLQQVDEGGNIIGEAQPQQPDAVFGVDGLARYAAGFEAALARHLDAQSNGSTGPLDLEPAKGE